MDEQRNLSKKRNIDEMNEPSEPSIPDDFETEESVELLESASTSSGTISVANAKKSKTKFANYFEITKVIDKHCSRNDKVATCKLCKKKNQNVQIKMKNSNTSGIQRHLANFHKKEYFEINQNQRQNSSNITKYFSSEVLKPSTTKEYSQEKFNSLLVELVARKHLPFSFFDDEFTKSVFEYINPRLKKSVFKILNNNQSQFSFTIDGWTSVANKSFYGITIHFIDDEWNLQSIVLDFVPSHGKHTGKDIAYIFKNTIMQNNLSIANKIIGITVDNASANTKFIHELAALLPNIDVNDQHFRCFAHVINLAVQDIMSMLKISNQNDTDNELDDNEHDDIDDFEDTSTSVNKLRSLLSKIKNSENLSLKLRGFCEIVSLKYNNPVMDVRTR
ncbi:uncharacterized protein [Cardiocondyla obscurior]|uniref:uncharacterized protein n=1 Tax=Cardiocondyla obscurior TaxID=286306 RepID=UPI00396567C7